jgi:hypothetical protein
MDFKRILLLSFALVKSTILFSQQSNNISYDFLIVSNSKDVTKKNYETLVNKLKSIYQNRVSFSNQSPFTIVPYINIVERKSTGEMHQNFLFKIDMGLGARNIDNNIEFNSYQKRFLIVGTNQDLAVAKAIDQIKFNDPALKDFFEVANNNIIKFYKENCDKIISSAKTNIARKEFNKAFNSLKYVPEDIACYKEVETLITSIYNSNKDDNCRKLLQQAHILEARQQYSKALDLLKYIDPAATCYKDVADLLQQIGRKVDKQVYRDFEMNKLKFIKLSDLEKVKILAEYAELAGVEVKL